MAKNRVHLDVLADEDLEAEVERLEELGASIRNWAEGDGGVWCVMQDPEGNEFCVMPPDDEAWPRRRLRTARPCVLRRRCRRP